MEEAIRENEEEMKGENPSWVAREMHEYYKRPEVVRENKMNYVELRLYEEIGLAESKKCQLTNKYRCPYGEQSNKLIENGRIARFIWEIVWWYNHHWNPSSRYTPPASDMKWYHYGEPSIIDVTSYEDILKALENGRFNRILEEYKKYMEEYKVT